MLQESKFNNNNYNSNSNGINAIMIGTSNNSSTSTTPRYSFNKAIAERLRIGAEKGDIAMCEEAVMSGAYVNQTNIVDGNMV